MNAYCQFGFDCPRSYAYNCRANRCECADGYRPDTTNIKCVGGM